MLLYVIYGPERSMKIALHDFAIFLLKESSSLKCFFMLISIFLWFHLGPYHSQWQQQSLFNEKCSKIVMLYGQEN